MSSPTHVWTGRRSGRSSEDHRGSRSPVHDDMGAEKGRLISRIVCAAMSEPAADSTATERLTVASSDLANTLNLEPGDATVRRAVAVESAAGSLIAAQTIR